MTSYKKSRGSIKSYFNWRLGRVRPVVERLNKIKNLKGLKILEVGCGYGAFLSLLLDKGASVVGTELNSESLGNAEKFLRGRKRCRLIAADGEHLPFADGTFDFVILFDVIEHVRNPKAMIKECIRVLKNGGILYVEFTPYYSITGHHLYDITKLPIHVLPRKWVKRIIFSSKPKGIFKPVEYWNDFKSLNKLRISEFQKYVRELSKINEKYIFKYPDHFEINLSFLSILGNLKDIFTISFEGIYKKQ